MNLSVICWLAMGTTTGVAATHQKGLSPFVGIIGWLVLGILTPLMFLASGNTTTRPGCRKRIKTKTAKTCPHCKRGIAAGDGTVEGLRFETTQGRK